MGTRQARGSGKFLVIEDGKKRSPLRKCRFSQKGGAAVIPREPAGEAEQPNLGGSIPGPTAPCPDSTQGKGKFNRICNRQVTRN